MYLDGQSGFANHERWKWLNRQLDELGFPLPATEDHQEQMLTRDKLAFHGWVMWAIANVGYNGRDQLFFHTFFARYHGLSRSGSDMLARFGYCMPRTRYMARKKEMVKSAKLQTKYVKKQCVRVLRFTGATSCVCDETCMCKVPCFCTAAINH